MILAGTMADDVQVYECSCCIEPSADVPSAFVTDIRTYVRTYVRRTHARAHTFAVQSHSSSLLAIKLCNSLICTRSKVFPKEEGDNKRDVLNMYLQLVARMDGLMGGWVMWTELT